jgi:hypothetical protein
MHLYVLPFMYLATSHDACGLVALMYMYILPFMYLATSHDACDLVLP